MIDDMQKLIDNYFQWLKDRTVLKEVEGDEGWVRVVTPHLDRHNDCIQFYARHAAHGLLLTDDGATIEDLKLSGCKLDSPKRKRLLEQTLASLGVQLGEGGEDLIVHATEANFALKKHSLLQAMLAVNDLFYLAQPHVASLFFEDVVSWLDLSEVRYTPKVKFTGKSGYDYMFDFVIPKFHDVPERFVQALTNPNRDTVGGLLYRWLDTRETREKGSKLYALLNDSNREVQGDVIDALRKYEATPVLWSERETVREALAA